MPLRMIPPNQITPDDLQQLVDNGVIENRQLDYKEELPNNSDKDKSEFLADVSAFANTLGGDLLLGIREQRDEEGQATGVPEAITGIEIANWDAERLRLENIIRDGLDPRVMGVQIESTLLPNERTVVIIRVPRSVQSPHMVIFRNWSKFFARNSGGKYQMDVSEVRQAFLQSAEWAERAERFRRERVEQVVSGYAPCAIEGGAKTFLHIIPLGFQPWALDFGNERVREVIRELTPLECSGGYHRLNFDGQLNFATSNKSGQVETYAQIFRNGSVEFCETRLLRPMPQDGKTPHPERISGTYFEGEILEGTKRALNVMSTLDVPLPYAIFLTLTSVRGYVMSRGRGQHIWSSDEVYPIDRESLYIPGQIVSTRGGQVDPIIKPILDSIWNATGFAESPNFNDEAIWTPPKN